MSNKLRYSFIAVLTVTVLMLSACAPATTQAPAATEAPATQAPAATEMPATEMPATEMPATEAPATEAATSGQVEIFSWWVGGGEAAGLAAMQKVFEAKYPDIKFVNAAVAGGSGTNARAVLATRLQAGDPPDSWQAHAGQEIIGTYVAADQVAPLDDFFTKSGFADVLPETLIPLISQDGHPYSVPVNIHRSNVMWYNPTVLSDAGVEVPTTMDEFFAACEKIKAAGKTCLALGPQWTAMHLFENIMIGSLGADKWNALWNTGADWTSADVKTALENYSKALSYTNSDAATLPDWQPAVQLVTNGDAAFNIMGDWADGYLENAAPDGLGLKAHTDFDWAPAPGTDGIFVFLSDSFVLPANAKHPDATNAWLDVAASKEGQEAFNPVKGSICARTDCDQSLFNEYLQSAGKDWTTDIVVGSLTHGVVANDSWKSKIDTALGLFLADPTKVDDFQTALADACASDGVCK